MASRSPNTESSSWLTHGQYLGALGEQAATFVAVLRGSTADAPVPSCPDWTALDLVRHVTQVYAHKTAVLRAHGQPVSGADVPVVADASIPEALRRHDAVLAELLEVLTELDPAAPAWTWMEGAGESTVGAWARRMAHEALIHRVDAELTAGPEVSPADDVLSIDGINEALTWMAGDPDLVADDPVPGCSGTVVLDYGTGAWLVDLGDGRHVVTPTDAGTRADAQLTGSPLELDLLLWGRSSRTRWPDAPAVDRLRARLAQAVS